MATKLIWTCDGCGDSVTMSQSSSIGSDWKRISVKLDGFKGYPVSAEHNAEQFYELCPACQRHLITQASPRSWPRSSTDGAAS
jgi:hypothetical protein